jgi:hypothetical protein
MRIVLGDLDRMIRDAETQLAIYASRIEFDDDPKESLVRLRDLCAGVKELYTQRAWLAQLPMSTRAIH